MRRPNRLLAIAALSFSLLLAACFNDDPNAGRTIDTTPTESACRAGSVVNDPAANPAQLAGRFEFIRDTIPQTAEEFVTQANKQGALGYRYSTLYTASDDPSAIYLCDTANPTVWAFETEPWVDAQLSFDGLRDLLDDQGEQGFRFVGLQSFTDGNAMLFVKNRTRIDRFAYRLLTPTATIADFIEQANTQGGEQYRYSGLFAYTISDFIEIYRRNTVTPQQYVYEDQPVATTAAAFVNQANAQGVDGFRYWSDRTSGARETRSIYIRNAGTPGLYSFSTLPVSANLGALLSQANAQGTTGRLRIADGAWTDGGTQAARTIYVDLNQCNCEPLELADPLVD